MRMFHDDDDDDDDYMLLVKYGARKKTAGIG
jgi:hypothetical protein